MVTRFYYWSSPLARYWLGRGGCSGTWSAAGTSSWAIVRFPSGHVTAARPIRQRRGCEGSEQGPVEKLQHQRRPNVHLSAPSAEPLVGGSSSRSRNFECVRSAISGRRRGLPSRFSECKETFRDAITFTPRRQVSIVVMPAQAFRIHSNSVSGRPEVELGILRLTPSTLRPECRADERLFQWKGVNTPQASVLPHPVLLHLAGIASHASLRETTNYGSGLRKFHIFCDIFSIREEDRLPASFALLHSFILWATSSPSVEDPVFVDSVPYIGAV